MRYAWDGMHIVAAIGLLYLGWSWFRLARDFADGVARSEWQWTTALFRGANDGAVYERSRDPGAFWWRTGLKVAIFSAFTLLFLIMLLET